MAASACGSTAATFTPRSGGMTSAPDESTGRAAASAPAVSPRASRTSFSMALRSIIDLSEERRVPGPRGQLAVLHQADLLQPPLELGRRPHAHDLAERRVVVERGRLVVEHHVVAHGQPHEEVAAG